MLRTKTVASAIAIAIAAVLLPAQNLSAQSDAYKGDTFKVGNWYGAAAAGDDGAFSHCTIRGAYVSKITLGFGLGRNNEFWAILHNSAWKLRVEATYPVTYAIDSFARRSGQVKAITSEAVWLALPGEASLFEELRLGRILQIVTPAETLSFRLEKTKDSLSALAACVNRHRAATASVIAPNAAQDRADTRQALRVEALQHFATLFAQGGFEGYRILTDKDVAGLKLPEAVASADIVWTGPNVAGVVHILPPDAKITMDRYSTMTLASDANHCKGTFLSGIVPDPSEEVRRLFTSCSTDGTEVEIRYIFVQRKDGSVYRIATFGDGPTPKAPEADQQIRGAIRSL